MIMHPAEPGPAPIRMDGSTSPFGDLHGVRCVSMFCSIRRYRNLSSGTPAQKNKTLPSRAALSSSNNAMSFSRSSAAALRTHRIDGSDRYVVLVVAEGRSLCVDDVRVSVLEHSERVLLLEYFSACL